MHDQLPVILIQATIFLFIVLKMSIALIFHEIGTGGRPILIMIVLFVKSFTNNSDRIDYQ